MSLLVLVFGLWNPMHILQPVLMLNLHHIDIDLGPVKVHSTKPQDLSWISWDPCDKERGRLSQIVPTSTPVLWHMWIHTHTYTHTWIHTHTHTCEYTRTHARTHLCKIDKIGCAVCTAFFKPQTFHLHLHGHLPAKISQRGFASAWIPAVVELTWEEKQKKQSLLRILVYLNFTTNFATQRNQQRQAGNEVISWLC